MWGLSFLKRTIFPSHTAVMGRSQSFKAGQNPCCWKFRFTYSVWMSKQRENSQSSTIPWSTGEQLCLIYFFSLIYNWTLKHLPNTRFTFLPRGPCQKSSKFVLSKSLLSRESRGETFKKKWRQRREEDTHIHKHTYTHTHRGDPNVGRKQVSNSWPKC